MMDIAIRTKFDKDILSFTVPYKMFVEMESNANLESLCVIEEQRVILIF